MKPGCFPPSRANIVIIIFVMVINQFAIRAGSSSAKPKWIFFPHLLPPSTTGENKKKRLVCTGITVPFLFS